jgi:Ca2+-dependent lipid-binding protein
LFISVADMVEDILQQSLPGFVDAVRITDLGQGVNPLRVTSIRALPDQPGDANYPKTGWIDEGNDFIKSKDTSGNEITEEQAGDYYNFEVAFSYAALPGQGAHLRAKNIHLLIEFFIGMYDWLHIPIPIWIQVEQIFGVVRLPNRPTSVISLLRSAVSPQWKSRLSPCRSISPTCWTSPSSRHS